MLAQPCKTRHVVCARGCTLTGTGGALAVEGVLGWPEHGTDSCVTLKRGNGPCGGLRDWAGYEKSLVLSGGKAPGSRRALAKLACAHPQDAHAVAEERRAARSISQPLVEARVSGWTRNSSEECMACTTACSCPERSSDSPAWLAGGGCPGTPWRSLLASVNKFGSEGRVCQSDRFTLLRHFHFAGLT